MTEDNETDELAEDDAPQVVVQKSKRPSIIWIFPLVAAAIAIGLGVRTFMEKGITIEITFVTADGLEAGKTKIKYKDVEIGLVDDVEVSPDASHIIVTASIKRNARKHLTEKTLFWVVRPRIGVGGISGLGTLISGAYINIDPGTGAPTKSLTFKGLEIPPVKPASAPGIKVVLHADRLGSVNVGSPIYYREIEVGKVEAYRLARDYQSVEIDAFVDEPHHTLVRKTSRFWNASGLSVSVGASGVSLKSESLVSLISGGIAFETPGDIQSAAAATAGDGFRLYDDHSEIDKEVAREKLQYVLYFDGSVRGLKIGAPVDLRGIEVGSVTDVELEYDRATKDVRIPVMIEIEPDRVHRIEGAADPRAVIAALVEDGMRAQLKTGSLLTGQLFIDLEFHHDAPAKRVGEGELPELPTVSGGVDAVLASVSTIMDTVSKLPLERIVKDADMAVQGLNDLIGTLNTEIKPVLTDVDGALELVDGVLKQAEKTLITVNDLLAEDSPITYDLARTLEELSEAARSVRVLAAYLERHPEALLRGKGGPGGS